MSDGARGRRPLLFSNSSILGHPLGTAVRVSDGRITDIGPVAELEATASRNTERVDLAGGMLSPGFQDSHVHPPMGGLQRLRCDLEPAENLDHAIRIITDHAARGEGWLLGGGWRYGWFPHGNPPAVLLDDITGRPVWLIVADGHSGWANRAALDLAGIDTDTPDPPDGVIVRRSDGIPQGTLHEGAMDLVEGVLPPDDPADIRRAILEGQQYLLSLGITAWQDAWVTPDVHDAYVELARSGDLRCRVRGALWWDRARGIEQLDELIERSHDGTGNYVPGTVKLMLDGVCENFTASMLHPYRDGDGTPTGNRGLDFIEPEALLETVAAIDAAGMQCHFHSLGDRAVRHALDAVEHARRVNGTQDTRPHLAHVQLIDPDDIRRFAPLDATANIQALWACFGSIMTDLTIPYLPPDRASLQYPFRSLVDSGAGLAMGSDWSVSTPDVLQQIGVATTRTRPAKGIEEPFLPEQRITAEVALAAFTKGSARVNFFDHDSGAIERGMRGDLAVISGDPRREDPFELIVTMTVLEGAVVHRT
ncbi:MAG: amidohydrolase [Acidimicrobiia bacterium]|nr:amidohydrolase [Acidimicrobiia bacterium]